MYVCENFNYKVCISKYILLFPKRNRNRKYFQKCCTKMEYYTQKKKKNQIVKTNKFILKKRYHFLLQAWKNL